jgi:hypothetical protein
MGTGMRTRTKFVAAILLLLLLTCGCQFTSRAVNNKRLQSWQLDVCSKLAIARETPPDSMSQEKWKFMVDMTGIGIPNCFSDANHIIDSQAFGDFAQELLDRLERPIDEQTIDWIWDNMATYSTIGKNGYVYRFRPTGSAFENGLKAYQK